jgi:hypothetical protein
MLKMYHRIATNRALKEFFEPEALETVISSNLAQDHLLTGQIGHPEFHFDHNSFTESWDYVEHNHQLIISNLNSGDGIAADRALGRLSHAVQDFYAHSNYVSLWLGRFGSGNWPPPDGIDSVDPEILNGTELRSGKIYMPFELLTWIPGIGGFFTRFLPRDSHAWMNLDSPTCGPAFDYALAAAVKRTRIEYERSIAGLDSYQIHLLSGKHGK